MNRKIYIELFEQYECVNYYSIRFKENKTETDQFFDKYENSLEFQNDIDIITNYLEIIGERGAYLTYFRPEGGNAKALPIGPSKLRLYCYKINDNIVLLGNGGLKTTRTYQEDPILNQYVEDLKNAGRLIHNLIKKGDIYIYNCQLYGKLDLYIK